MNRKGLYSGGVALATIVLIIAISFNTASTVQAGESQGKADAIIDAEWEAQNAGHLLEAKVVDIMVDTIYNNECEYTEIDVKNTVEAVDETYGNCSVSNITYDDSGVVSIDIEFECNSIAREGLMINYRKTISLQKTIDVIAGINCQITIDDQSERLFGLLVIIDEP